jgi:tRNA pseudouridine55 synthase
MEGQKAYHFTVRWGIERDTDDAEGQVTQTSGRRPSPAEIEAVLPRFTGAILQTPPQFSALKIAGERAYDLARDGEKVELAPREVLVESLTLDGCPDENTAIFSCFCGKGTYVRALARDIGRILSCFGHITALRRTQVGPFGEDQAVTLQAIEAGQARENGLEVCQLLQPVATVLDDIPALAVTQGDANRLRNGQPIVLRANLAPVFLKDGHEVPIWQGPAYATCSGELIALGDLEKGQFAPTRVFNLGGSIRAPKDERI